MSESTASKYSPSDTARLTGTTCPRPCTGTAHSRAEPSVVERPDAALEPLHASEGNFGTLVPLNRGWRYVNDDREYVVSFHTGRPGVADVQIVMGGVRHRGRLDFAFAMARAIVAERVSPDDPVLQREIRTELNFLRLIVSVESHRAWLDTELDALERWFDDAFQDPFRRRNTRAPRDSTAHRVEPNRDIRTTSRRNGT